MKFLKFSAATLLASVMLCRAEVKVVVSHNDNDHASTPMKFKDAPAPSGTDAATKAVISLVDGEGDSAGGELNKLNDGKVPTEEDQPSENFFFPAGSSGGRIVVDLKSAAALKQVNTYSWHPNTRGPQVYKLYASDGSGDGFKVKPVKGDPATMGWKLLANVDSRPKDGSGPGGQYAVSISDTDGSLGTYRYLLLDCSPTETEDDFGNTFYSEIDVVTSGDAAPAAAASSGPIKVVVDHNTGDSATPAFKFKNVPSPSKTDAATKAKLSVLEGEQDPAGGDLLKLTDGAVPAEEDLPAENFFFNQGTPGGRILVDLNSAIAIRQINTYSWHANTRGPQVYTVYGLDGGADARSLKGDPEKSGWKLIAKVDTRPKSGDVGGQYGVSISGGIGKFRYLVFDCSAAETEDTFGNTFYSEIDVVADDGSAQASAATGDEVAAYKPFVINAPDGSCEITIDVSQALDLKEWSETKLAPVLAEWYPKLSAMLASDGYVAPKKFSIKIAPGNGVAATGGTRVTANSTWIRGEIGKQAIGSLLHEEIHVIQQYGLARRGGVNTASNSVAGGATTTTGVGAGSAVVGAGGGNSATIGGTSVATSTGTADGSTTNRPAGTGRRNRGGGGGNRNNTGWLTEGIPDYIRWYLYEPESHGTNIRNPDRVNYNDSYRTSANFLNYVVGKYDKDLIMKLNAALRQGNYTPEIWVKATGKTVEELGTEWKEDLKKEKSPAPGKV